MSGCKATVQLLVAFLVVCHGRTVHASRERECALKTLAFEFGSARIANTAALHDGLRLNSCAGAPPRPPTPQSLPLPRPPAAPVKFFVSTSGNDTHAGTQAAPFATLLRASHAVRASACRKSRPPCAAVVIVMPGQYDLNETLALDERDSRVTWQAAGPGVHIGGSVRIPSSSLAWTPWTPPRSNCSEQAFVADIGSALPPQVRHAITLVAEQTVAATGRWNYGPPPPLINQLFVNNARQILARYPNGDPEASSGLCFQGPELPGEEGCESWLIPDGAVKAKQPSGHSHNKLNNYPNCQTEYCVNRGVSPTWGCGECHTCGTFGPYFVNDPPPDHPLYGNPAKPLVYGWKNNSVQSFWSDIFARPGGVVSYATTNRSRQWSQPDTGIIHMFHGALWGWWAFNIASIEQSDAAPQVNFGYGGHQEARGWSVTDKSAFYVENILEEMDQPGEWYFEQDKLLLYLIPNATKGHSIDNIDVSLPVLNTLISIASNRSTPQTEQVHDVAFVGFDFSQTRSTFMSEPYEVPSAGDWSVHRGGAVFIEAARNITIESCKFNQTGGNAIVLSGYVTDSAIVQNEFERIGDSAIVLLGAAEIDD
eukprot:COSAG02_NODE_3586_length_6523_cov_2.494630_5_plen_594_part_01